MTFSYNESDGWKGRNHCVCRACHRQRLTFSITESKCTCVAPSELLFLCVWVCVCVCVCVHLCGLRCVLAADGKEVIHLVTVISQSPCVCTFLRIWAGVFVHVCGTCMCLGPKVSACMVRVCACVHACVCGESGGKVKKHDLWKGVVLESSRYSNACKS